MSYTVVIDEREREQRLENRLNIVVRHCKIGRIRRKMVIHGGDRVPIGNWGPALPTPSRMAELAFTPIGMQAQPATRESTFDPRNPNVRNLWVEK